ncbi:DNA-binding transcriptional regulator [Streptomyces sp. DH12]|uniref:helix-turn-helix domain-containing protein n=1 Tax=Streptomyces sp. DH12 TaxID=2857010 RepID=UPI001E55753E|nr:transcriptional regulator [Streptomyces sp. DH12]
MQYTDPPDMPEDERMTPAEFKVVREFLGLTGDWLARHLGVSPRTVRHWEQGKYAIPDGVRLALEDLEARTAAFVSGIADALMDLPDPGVITYRDDAEYRVAHPEVDWPASWHRAVIARVAQEVPGLSITYPEQASQEAASGRASQRNQ